MSKVKRQDTGSVLDAKSLVRPSIFANIFWILLGVGAVITILHIYAGTLSFGVTMSIDAILMVVCFLWIVVVKSQNEKVKDRRETKRAETFTPLTNKSDKLYFSSYEESVKLGEEEDF